MYPISLPRAPHWRHAVLALALCQLCACERTPTSTPSASAPATSASAASQSSSAASTANAPAASQAVATSAPVDKAAQVAAQKQLETLLQAALGKDWKTDKKAGLRELPDADNRDQHSFYLITPLAQTRLDDGQIVLAANASPSDAAGSDMSSHASSGGLCLYWLKQEGEGWKLMRKEENVLNGGSMGQIGSATFSARLKGSTLLELEGGGTWQGYSVTFLSLVQIKPDGARVLADGISESSDSEGACGPDTSHCWNASSEWRFADDASAVGKDGMPDLLIQFSLDESDLIAEGKPGRRDKKRQGSAVYRFGDKGYTLLKGENIIPGV